MAELTLPPVAGKIYVECKKCEAERYHVVVAHVNATSAKVQCEICKSKKTFKLPSASAAKRPVTGAAAKKKAASAEAKKNAHSQEYNNLLAAATADGGSYNIKNKFNTNQKLKHPKFGTGIIRMALPDKIEVVFEDEVRMLVHNRV